MLPDRVNEVDDDGECRRDWSRTVSDEGMVAVLTAQGPLQAVIVDESFGGMGLLIVSQEEFLIGHQVGLLYGGMPLNAVIRWVHPLENGQQHLGVEWRNDRRQQTRDRRRMTHKPAKVSKERRQAQADRRQNMPEYLDEQRQARLVSIGGLPVVCGLPENQKGGMVKVILPGGLAQEVRLEDLQCSSMLERRAQLEELNQELSILIGVYELGHPETKDEAIEAVLNYEFAESPA